MPSNWLYIDTNFPTFTKEQSTDEKVTSIQNYVYMLVEQMRWTLNHLDWSNFNQTELGKFQNLITEPLMARIEDDEGNLAQLALAASGIASQVSNQAGQISLISQKADRIDWIVAGGTDASSMTLTESMISLISSSVSIDGVVTFTDLATCDGSTVIDAGNISTGVIDAEVLSLYGLLDLEYGTGQNRQSYGYVGATTAGQYAGAVMCDQYLNNYFIVTVGGARMTFTGNGEDTSVAQQYNSIFVANGGCYSTSGTYFDSDRRVKEDIRYDVDGFENVFDLLRPCTFYRVGDRSKRRAGLIAQEVLAALEETETDVNSFGALGWRIEDGDKKYSVAYGELVPLCIAEIQRLKQRVKELEGRT